MVSENIKFLLLYMFVSANHSFKYLMERLLHKAGDTQGSYSDDRRLERQKGGDGQTDRPIRPRPEGLLVPQPSFRV